jgi:hypothetical protein
MSDEICRCGCHDHPEVIHFFSCCQVCPKCHIRIVHYRLKSHVCDPEWAKFADHVAKAMSDR